MKREVSKQPPTARNLCFGGHTRTSKFRSKRPSLTLSARKQARARRRGSIRQDCSILPGRNETVPLTESRVGDDKPFIFKVDNNPICSTRYKRACSEETLPPNSWKAEPPLDVFSCFLYFSRKTKFLGHFVV